MTRGFNPSRVSNNATVASFQYSYSHITTVQLTFAILHYALFVFMPGVVSKYEA
nr:MAG TPA: hypothetical protein [Caudoviricetes sp.]